MVKFWYKQLDDAIKRTKYRITFAEKHGMGNTTMQEKARLKIQERKKELLK